MGLRSPNGLTVLLKTAIARPHRGWKGAFRNVCKQRRAPNGLEPVLVKNQTVIQWRTEGAVTAFTYPRATLGVILQTPWGKKSSAQLGGELLQSAPFKGSPAKE